MTTPDTVTIAEAAELTGFTVLALQRLAARGRLGAVKVKGRWRIPRRTVEHYRRFGRWPPSAEKAARLAARRSGWHHGLHRPKPPAPDAPVTPEAGAP